MSNQLALLDTPRQKGRHAKLRDKRKAHGQCIECGKPKPEGWAFTQCFPCKAKINAKVAAWSARNRKPMGPFQSHCVCCSRAYLSKVPNSLACSKKCVLQLLSLARYGMTKQQWDATLIEQSGRCAICREPFSDGDARKGRAAQIDHHHDTGRIRGLLCGSCNRAVGLIQESPSAALAMADYLGAAEETFMPGEQARPKSRAREGTWDRVKRPMNG